jgi:hypothetical protein
VSDDEKGSQVPLLTMRVALVLLVAGVVGIVAGVLALFAAPKRSIAVAILVGGSAAGGSLGLFNTLIT